MFICVQISCFAELVYIESKFEISMFGGFSRTCEFDLCHLKSNELEFPGSALLNFKPRCKYLLVGNKIHLCLFSFPLMASFLEKLKFIF